MGGEEFKQYNTNSRSILRGGNEDWEILRSTPDLLGACSMQCSCFPMHLLCIVFAMPPFHLILIHTQRHNHNHNYSWQTPQIYPVNITSIPSLTHQHISSPTLTRYHHPHHALLDQTDSCWIGYFSSPPPSPSPPFHCCCCHHRW